MVCFGKCVLPAVAQSNCGSDKHLPVAFKVTFLVITPRIQASLHARGASFVAPQGRRAQVSSTLSLPCCALLVLGTPALSQGDTLLWVTLFCPPSPHQPLSPCSSAATPAEICGQSDLHTKGKRDSWNSEKLWPFAPPPSRLA